MHLQPQGQVEPTCRAQGYVGSTVLLDSDIQRPQNSGLHLPSAVFQAQFQEMVYLSPRHDQLVAGEG